MKESLFQLGLKALLVTDPAQKRQLVEAIWDKWNNGELCLPADEPVVQVHQPGRPDKPDMVSPRDLKKRKLSTPLGHASFIHALAHIEFNAINLALDAVYRFRGMPGAFYTDWLSVAREEAHHHHLVAERLVELGYRYGDFPAHNGLWDMAVQTDTDLLQRMALIPCVFEARGLDVTPPMIERLQAMGDHKSAKILMLILKDEVGHVAIGQKWFHWECNNRNLAPQTTLVELITTFLPGRKHGPFNVSDRLKAGFSQDQLTRLETLR